MYFVSGLQGHAVSASPCKKGRSQQMDTADKRALVPKGVQDDSPHPGHNPHAHGYVGGVRKLHTYP